jgi:hypothetical protein
MDRLVAVFGAVVLSCLPYGLCAKQPEMGGPRQFDLNCRGEEKRVVERYLPGFHRAGPPGGEKSHYPAQSHLTIDMIGMKFQEKPPVYSGAPPNKIFKYDANEATLVLKDDERSGRHWAIRLDNYNSTAVSEEGSGEIWVEHMACRVAPFSGF